MMKQRGKELKKSHHNDCIKAAVKQLIKGNGITSVMATISYTRENYHSARSALTFGLADGDGSSRVVPIEMGKNLILPVGIYNRFIMLRESCPKDENPMMLKCIASRFFLEDGEECNHLGINLEEKENTTLVDKDKERALALIESGDLEGGLKLLGQELPKLEKGEDEDEETGDDVNVEASSEYEYKEVDGAFKVYKVGSDHCVRSLGSKQDAIDYIASKDIPEE